MENENKLFYNTYENGKLTYRMIDAKSDIRTIAGGSIIIGAKTRQCKLEFYSKELVALNPDVDRSYGFKYTYKIVPDPNKRFRKQYNIYLKKDELTDELVTEIKSE